MKISVKALRSLIKEVLLLEDAVNQDQALEIIKKYPKGMQAMNVNPTTLKPIITGTRGTAFDIGNNTVLKVTNDDKEAQAAASLLGHSNPNIVKFYNVWQFGNTGIYGITQELLVPLPKQEGQELDKALVATGLPIWIKRAEGSFENAKKLTKEYVLQQIKKKFQSATSPEAIEYAKQVNAQWNLLIKKFNLRGMFETLTKLGIDFHDYHAGNMMKRPDGTLVLIDLGMSNVRNAGKINVINEGKSS